MTHKSIFDLMEGFKSKGFHGENSLWELYENSIDGSGRPWHFSVFDKKVLADFDWLLETTKHENPGWGAAEQEIEQYINWGLVPELHRDDGTRGFPLYVPSRLGFVKELILKWDYSPERLKHITDFEEILIETLTAFDALYGEESVFDFYISNMKDLIKENEEQLKLASDATLKESLKKGIMDLQSTLDLFGYKAWDDLSQHQQREVESAAFMFKSLDERTRISLTGQFRAQALLGFSPTVHFKGVGSYPTNSERPGREEYVYTYDDGNTVWGFNDWTTKLHSEQPIGEDIDFFATPEFLMEISEDKEIIIRIREPHKVDAKYMRRIQTVYNAFRKGMDPPKARWGEKSGSAQLLEERNRTLRETYRKFREKKPRVSADEHLSKVLQMIGPQYGYLSLHRARSIIYSKESKES